LIDGSVMVKMSGALAVGEVPSGATQDTANETTYDWPRGSLLTSKAEFSTAARLTLDPLGSAAAGMRSVARAPLAWSMSAISPEPTIPSTGAP
jgi:hypothetical protein